MPIQKAFQNNRRQPRCGAAFYNCRAFVPRLIALRHFRKCWRHEPQRPTANLKCQLNMSFAPIHLLAVVKTALARHTSRLNRLRIETTSRLDACAGRLCGEPPSASVREFAAMLRFAARAESNSKPTATWDNRQVNIATDSPLPKHRKRR